MIDTPKEILENWEASFETMSGEERVKMACSMFEFARDLVADSLRNENPGISDSELSKGILMRFYSDDFDIATLTRWGDEFID